MFQLVSAFAMYRLIPGRVPSWIGTTHVWSGRLAVLASVPVAVHCLYALGFQSADSRVFFHSLFGCFFYGVFATKMVLLTRKDARPWVIPFVGGLLFFVLVYVWLTSALWFFQTTAAATDGAVPVQAIARTADVPVGSGVIVDDVVITQPAQGKFNCFSAICTHAGCTVAEVVGASINCPCHGSSFNLDGTVAKGPAIRPLDAKGIAVEGDSIVLKQRFRREKWRSAQCPVSGHR